MRLSQRLAALAEGQPPETEALLRILALSEADVEAGRTLPADQVFARVRERVKAQS